MKRMVGTLVIGFLMATAGSALALPPPGEDPPGGDDDGGDDPPPPPDPPPPQSLLFTAQKTGSIGGSAVGASFQGALQAYTDASRRNVNVRAYASGAATLLGNTTNLGIINSYAKAGDAGFGTEMSIYVLGSQVFAYNDSFPGTFLKHFSAVDWRANLWQWERNWTWAGTGAKVRLAIDGGFTLNGTVYGGWLYAGGQLEARAWGDVGGALSFHFLWIEAGSISGTIHLFDATASGDLNIDISALIHGVPGSYSLSGWARLCSGGGFIRGCVFGRCGDIARWSDYCPGWASLSGQISGSIGN